jgi:hypothetical protein
VLVIHLKKTSTNQAHSFVLLVFVGRRGVCVNSRATPVLVVWRKALKVSNVSLRVLRIKKMMMLRRNNDKKKSTIFARWLAAAARWIRFHVDNPVLAVWKIFFALVAIMDMSTCWSLLVQGWIRGEQQHHHEQQQQQQQHQDKAIQQKVCLDTSAAEAASHQQGGLKFPFNNNSHHNKSHHATCSAAAAAAAAAAEPTWPFFFSSSSSSSSSFSTLQRYGWIWKRFVLKHAAYIGPLFGLLCLVEAVVRAREARMLAIENQALDNFEKSLERVYSSTRMSFRRRFSTTTTSPKLHQQQRRLQPGQGGGGDDDDSMDTTLERVLARSTLRTWIPTMAVICFWLALVPIPTPVTTPIRMSSISSLYTCGNDTALTTFWITNTLIQYALVTKRCQEFLLSTLLAWALPYKLHQQPIRFYHRIRQLLRWIRYARFAFPLCRMFLKLLDQVSALTKTWQYVYRIVNFLVLYSCLRNIYTDTFLSHPWFFIHHDSQSVVAQTEKAKRLARRSMIFEDIRKIESLAKVQTALAALPSQLFRLSSAGGGGAGTAGEAKLVDSLHRQQKQGRKLQRQLHQLKMDVHSDGDDTSTIATSDLYDRVVLLTQQLKVVMNNTLLSSHHLISPRSRFSVVWRITVTNCLLLELFRLSVSWHLSESFKISLTQIISRLLVDCKEDNAEEFISKHFTFITDRVHDIHRRLFEAIPLFLPPPDDLIRMICVPSTASARLLLQLGAMLEDFVDVVSFVDIFIWFFTGDLDVQTGVIVPKPFFTRCILPGTLVQVLDHPTLPETLPTLIAQAMNAARAVGWSRAIRWVLAIGPAFIMLVVNPCKLYFFRHMDHIDQDIIMRYAESCGMLAPAKPSNGGWTISTASVSALDSGEDLRNRGGGSGGASHHPTTTSTSTSQVGLSLFDSPALMGRSIVRTGGGNEDSNMAASNSYIPPLPLPPPLSSILSPPSLRHNRSIHFDPSIIGGDEDDDHDHDHDDDYQFSYSTRSLNVDD